jgi:hypothetical protein
MDNAPVRSAPVTKPTASAKANPSPIKVTPAQTKPKPFSPTISPALTVNVRPLPSDDKGKPKDWRGTIDSEVAGSCKMAPEEKSTSNWLGLLSFYVVCLLGLIILWVIYDIIKDSIQMKKRGTPIKDHLSNLKKPAKGTRKSREKATTKKKTTRKKKS